MMERGVGLARSRKCTYLVPALDDLALADGEDEGLAAVNAEETERQAITMT